MKKRYITQIFSGTFMGNYFLIYDDGQVVFGFFLDQQMDYFRFTLESPFVNEYLCRQIQIRFRNKWKLLSSTDDKWAVIMNKWELEDLLERFYNTVIDRAYEHLMGNEIPTIVAPLPSPRSRIFSETSAADRTSSL